MRTIFALLLFLSAFGGILRGETPPRWVEVKSPNFVVLTDTNEKQGRKIATQFERMRAVFHTVLPNATGGAGSPITVLAMKDRKGFQALEPVVYLAKGQLDLAGLFLRTQDENYILLRLDAEGEHPFATVYHEYTHLLMSKATWIPLWLSEGLAEFYQNTDIRDKDVLLGQASEYDILYLREHRLLPLAVLLAVDHASPYYHEEQKGSVFYAESWALTHYIEILDGEKNTHRMQDYARLLAGGDDPISAAQKAFGDLKELQKALEKYIGQGAFRAYKVNSAFVTDEASFAARPVPAASVDVVRANVLVGTGRIEEARSLLDAVLRADPANGPAYEAMGTLKFRQGDIAGAKKNYAEAVKLDLQSYLAHFYYAVMSLNEGDRDQDAAIEASLRKAIALKPDFAPAYDGLASFLASRHERLDEAHVLNVKAVQLDPASLQFRLNTASVLEQENRYPGALGVLNAARKIAKTPEEMATVDHLLNQVEQYQAAMDDHQSATAQRSSGDGAVTTVVSRKQMDGVAVKDPGAGKVVVFKKVNGKVAGAVEEVPNYPAGDSKGKRHTVEGVLRGVQCSYPSVLTLNVEQTGSPVKLYNNDFYKINFTVSSPEIDNDIKPCTSIEGAKARVVYAEVSHDKVTGQIVAIELTK